MKFFFDMHFWFHFLKLLHMAEVLIQTDKKQELFMEMFTSSWFNDLHFGKSSWMFARQPSDHTNKCGYEILGFTSLLNVIFVSCQELRCTRQVLQILPNSPRRRSGASAVLSRDGSIRRPTAHPHSLTGPSPNPISLNTHPHTISRGLPS